MLNLGVMLLLASLAPSAQEAVVAEEPAAAEEHAVAEESAAAEEPAPEAVSRGAKLRVSFGAQWGQPSKLSGSLTLMRGGIDDTGAMSGFLLQLQPGQAGGKASLGWGFAWFDQGPPFPVLGGALRATFARTWGEPRGTEPDSGFVGLEADINFGGIKATIGRLFRVSGPAEGSITSWSLGFGF